MKKEKSDSCMESAGSRSDFQKEENKLFFSLFLCVYVCMCVIDNGNGMEV